MRSLLAVSPHLDDAVFSIGALLARRAAAGWRVVVATCFTGSVDRPTGFALACQTDKGLGPEVDYMDLRRAEDRRACSLLGAEAIHLPFAEAPHRGYASAAALFGPRLETDGMVEELAPALARLIEELKPDRLFGPAGIGGHVDHLIVRDALGRVAPAASLWADLPYAARSRPPLPAGGFTLPCGAEFERKLAAARAYGTQIGFQFGRADRIGDMLGDHETIWPPAPVT